MTIEKIYNHNKKSWNANQKNFIFRTEIRNRAQSICLNDFTCNLFGKTQSDLRRSSHREWRFFLKFQNPCVIPLSKYFFGCTGILCKRLSSGANPYVTLSRGGGTLPHMINPSIETSPVSFYFDMRKKNWSKFFVENRQNKILDFENLSVVYTYTQQFKFPLLSVCLFLFIQNSKNVL